MDDTRELRDLLAASLTFGGLDAAVLADLASAMHRDAVGPGQTLVREGQASDALFVVAAGCFELRQRRADGSEEAVGRVGRGDVIGEVQLVVGGLAWATVVALGEAEVFRLPRRAFADLSAVAPALLETLVRVVGRQLQRRQMLAVLPEMFGPLDAATLAGLERHVTWVTLRSGELLFRQGDRGDAWYVVTSGRLAIVQPAHNGEVDRVIAEVGRGEGVGEMALLTGQPRSATVYALRDAELARFPVDQVTEMLATQPRVTQAMLRGLAGRIMQQSVRRSAAKAIALTLTLVPASPDVAVDDLARRLSAALGRFGPTRQIGSAETAAPICMRSAWTGPRRAIPARTRRGFASTLGWTSKAQSTVLSCWWPMRCRTAGAPGPWGMPTV